MKATFLGIDLGTNSAKGVIVDENGEVVATSSISHKMSNPFPGHFEQDADDIWWYDTVTLSLDLVSQLEQKGISKSTLKGMCVSTTAPCVLPVDKDGKPLRPGIMYGIDTRATKQIAQLEEAIGKDNIFEMGGQHLSSQSMIPKVKWIEENEPEVFKKTAKVLTSSGYLVYKLTGRYTTDIYDAIGYIPFFDIKNIKWETKYEKHLFSSDLLPEMLWTTETVATISKQAAQETSLPEGLPILTGTADAAAEAMSCGVSGVGDMMMMYGSSNFFIMLTSLLRPVPQFWASNYFVPGSTVLTGGMATVGSLFNWFNDTFPGRSFKEWEELAKSSTAGANGVIVLPYLAGERTPMFAPNAKAVMFGMQLSTTPGDIYQALQEAIGFGIRHNIEVLKEKGEEAKRIVAIGGVTSSAMTSQIISDAANCVQQIPSQRLGACYGDAFLAALGVGAVDSMQAIHNWVSIEKEYLPDPTKSEIYLERYHTYRELYESTKHLM